MFLLDSNVYIRGIREATFNTQIEGFYRAHLSSVLMSAVVASELLVGARTPLISRTLTRTFVDPFVARRRFLVPGWSTWEWATKIDRGIRKQGKHGAALGQRSFFHDILIAASAREAGATIVTFNTADFALIAQHVDIDVVEPWPDGLAA